MRNFSARETAWLQELDGIELAGFWQRACAFAIDSVLVLILFSILATLSAAAYVGIQQHRGKPALDFPIPLSEQQHGQIVAEKKLPNGADVRFVKPPKSETLHVISEIVVPVLYFGILLWKGQGRTPGKRLMKIRVVSLVHPHITFWHAAERALGYGAAALELGFGFFQFFIHPYRRCAQDRLAETIVVTERGYTAMRHKFEHHPIPETEIPDPGILDTGEAQPSGEDGRVAQV